MRRDLRTLRARWPINAVSFLAWVQQCLVTTPKRRDIVVMDNIGSHKDSAVYRAIRAAGAMLIFLPPYSPDLNPIEQVFAKLKALLRRINARTVTNTWTGIGTVFDAFSSSRFSPRVAALRLSSCDIVNGDRPNRRATSRTPNPCARQSAISSRSANAR